MTGKRLTRKGKNVRYHRRAGTFPVRARDGNDIPERLTEHLKELSPRHNGQAAAARRQERPVVFGHSVSKDNHLIVCYVISRVANDDGYTHIFKSAGERIVASVTAAHLLAHFSKENGKRAHTHAADADKIKTSAIADIIFLHSKFYVERTRNIKFYAKKAQKSSSYLQNCFLTAL